MINPIDIMTKEAFEGTNGLTIQYRKYVPENYTPSEK